jgi:hypothetical protein
MASNGANSNGAAAKMPLVKRKTVDFVIEALRLPSMKNTGDTLPKDTIKVLAKYEHNLKFKMIQSVNN